MELLLDTHSLIWFLNGDKKLSDIAKAAIENPANSKFVSMVSIWEISIKISLNKFIFKKGFRHFLNMVEENGFEILPLSFEHAIKLSTLEFIHRDPFDRLLICQCLIDKLTIITKDDNIKKYKIKSIW